MAVLDKIMERSIWKAMKVSTENRQGHQGYEHWERLNKGGRSENLWKIDAWYLKFGLKVIHYYYFLLNFVFRAAIQKTY